jgi:ring-1,2-phenylacetyl-CoA epoxidase subunit PaaD
MVSVRERLEQVQELVAAVPDPEIPVVTIEDLGILRDVAATYDGRVVVTLTPTYSGCPAIDPIRRDVERAVREAGIADVEVRLQLAPAWTTDWLSEPGRAKLAAYGIAPPAPVAGADCPLADRTPRCPRCGSHATRLLSRFGATPCQAQHACDDCLEPFDAFKSL